MESVSLSSLSVSVGARGRYSSSLVVRDGIVDEDNRRSR